MSLLKSFEKLRVVEIAEGVAEPSCGLLLADLCAEVIPWYGQGAAVSWRAVLSLRGKFRRMRCQFPPLRVQFKKDTLRALGLADHNDLKLVTHCMDDPDSSRENILREYLCYRLYNILTPIS